MKHFNREYSNENVPINNAIIEKDNKIFQLKSIINDFPGDIYWKDKNGIYLGINATGSESLRNMGFTWKESDIIGKTDYDLYDQNTADEFRKNDFLVMQKKSIQTKEETAILPSGKKITQLSTKRPLFNKNGEVIGIVGNTIDITDKKEAEEREKIALLESAESKAKTQGIEHQLKGMTIVTATIAHELRTPLVAIKAAARGLELIVPFLVDAYKNAITKKIQEETVSQNQIKLLEDAIDSIVKKVDQSNMVIDMLLSNIQNRTIEITDFEVCSAKDCIQKAINQYAFFNTQPEIEVFSDKDFTFRGKEMLVLHIFFNLFKNAIYFIQKARTGKIIIWIEPGKGANEIHFKDTATGISEEYLPKIFDDFFTHGTNKGTGIGLSFCKKTMQAIGGDITCKSVYGEYTEFILSFPPLIK